MRDKRNIWGGINRRWAIDTEVIERANGVRHVWRLNEVWVSWCWFAVGGVFRHPSGLRCWGFYQPLLCEWSATLGASGVYLMLFSVLRCRLTGVCIGIAAPFVR